MTVQMQNFMLILNTAMHHGENGKPMQPEEPVDWAGLSMLARKQNLLPLFADIAQRYESYRVYPGFAKDTQDAMEMAAAQIQKTVEFLDLYKAFLSRGLSPVVFKGIALRQLYGQYADLRTSGDEDILIRPEEFEAVREVLEDKGFRCAHPDLTKRQLERMHEVRFSKPEIQSNIEVHLNIFGEANKVLTYMNRTVHPFSDTEILEIEGVPLRVMNPSQAYLCLVFHAFKHFLANSMGIRHIMDILKYEQTYKERICFAEIEAFIKAVHADAFLRDIRWIGSRYFSLPAKENLQACCPQELLDDIIDTHIFGALEKASRYASNISLAASSADTKNWKLRGLLRGAFPHRVLLVDKYPYLEERPWLLPAVWVLRFIKFGSYEGKGNLPAVHEALNKAERHMNLLRKYRQ